ncbi:MAG: polysaccharide biosynthesis protein [Rhodoferax sp.]|nr:polysaccharide biosynthesis protein [Rhodoferax sp.]MCP5182219.1 polysaccharide biosynthesis protein [Pseudomonadales bacterium]
MLKRLLKLPRIGKQLTVILMDVVLATVATWLAFSLRLDTLHWPVGLQWRIYWIAPLLAVPIFVYLGLYRAIFRYTGMAALMAIARAVGVYAVILFALLVWQRWPDVPRSIGVLQPLIFLLLAGSSRAMARFWLAGFGWNGVKSEGRLLIYGAGQSGVQTAAALGNATQYTLVGFIDDDVAKAGRSINGARVHLPSAIDDLVKRRGVTDILLALPSASRSRRNAIIASLRHVPVHVRSLPGISDLTSGRVKVSDIKELDIEDLLGRDPVVPVDSKGRHDIRGQTVLVTGAGGSIGSELCRQIVLEQPVRLVLLDHNEFGLYTVHQELLALCRARALKVEIVAVLGSVRNRRRLQELLREYRPSWIYHAAAYKHVPLVESNPSEGIENNVIGSLNMASVAMESGVANFVLVSTDKAVRPTNVMGASKRLAEMVLQALAARADSKGTRFSMVRFGNVLGSSGSVVPLFRAQLASGGPLTVTHPEVTRYFMTIPEAAQLVLLAGSMAEGGEVFVLDMGQPVKIMDLAMRMVELSGLRVRDELNPDGDIAIEISGLRPGEKLYEELLIGNNPTPSAHPRIMKAHEEFLPWEELQVQLEQLREAIEMERIDVLKDVLRTCVNGYVDSAYSPLK